MSSYVKKKNCCLLRKSKKYIESIKLNTNQIINMVKNNQCTLNLNGLERIIKMRNTITNVLKGWSFFTWKKLNSEITICHYMILNIKNDSFNPIVGDIIDIQISWCDLESLDSNINHENYPHGRLTYNLELVEILDSDNYLFKEDIFNSHILFDINFTNLQMNINNITNIKQDSIIINGGYEPDDSIILNTIVNNLQFNVDLYMTGAKLQAVKTPMFSLIDAVNNPFAIGTDSEIKETYENNTDILIEDASEFLQAINKLVSLMKKLSIDNKRDPDTKLCCTGNAPSGGKSSC